MESPSTPFFLSYFTFNLSSKLFSPNFRIYLESNYFSPPPLLLPWAKSPSPLRQMTAETLTSPLLSPVPVQSSLHRASRTGRLQSQSGLVIPLSKTLNGFIFLSGKSTSSYSDPLQCVPNLPPSLCDIYYSFLYSLSSNPQKYTLLSSLALFCQECASSDIYKIHILAPFKSLLKYHLLCEVSPAHFNFTFHLYFRLLLTLFYFFETAFVAF